MSSAPETAHQTAAFGSLPLCSPEPNLEGAAQRAPKIHHETDWLEGRSDRIRTCDRLATSAGLALQGDHLLTAHRILSRGPSHSRRSDLGQPRDSARALQAQTACIDRLGVAVVWRAAEQASLPE
jgi:hypothetical protein